MRAPYPTPMPAAPALIAICKSCGASPITTMRDKSWPSSARKFVGHGEMRLRESFIGAARASPVENDQIELLPRYLKCVSLFLSCSMKHLHSAGSGASNCKGSPVAGYVILSR